MAGRKHVAALATAAVFLFLSPCITATAAAQDAEPDPASIMVGGWSAADANSATVRAAAMIAIPRLGVPRARLARINSAQQQVVQGTNYRIDLTLTNGSRWVAELHHALDGTMRVTHVVERRAAAEPQAAAGPPMVGGMSQAPVTDDVRAAAAFAVPRLGRPGAALASIDAVRRQVVQGTNYSIDLTLTDGTRWRALVYRALDGAMQLTSSTPLPTN